MWSGWRLGSEDPSRRRACEGGAAVLAETPRGRVLSLAADGPDELADIVEPGEAPGVDGLVHLAEASRLGWCSAGRGGDAERGKSGDGSCGENAFHVTSLLLGGCWFTHQGWFGTSTQSDCFWTKRVVGPVRGRHSSLRAKMTAPGTSSSGPMTSSASIVNPASRSQPIIVLGRRWRLSTLIGRPV